MWIDHKVYIFIDFLVNFLCIIDIIKKKKTFLFYEGVDNFFFCSDAGEVGCTIYSCIFLYLLELWKGNPDALLKFHCTKHL